MIGARISAGRSTVLSLLLAFLAFAAIARAEQGAGYGGVGKLLTEKENQSALHLSADQSQQVSKLVRDVGGKYRDSLAGLRSMPASERLPKYNKILDEMNAEMFKGLQGVLDAGQLEHLGQMDRHSQGLRIFRDPQVMKELNFSDEQKEKFAKIIAAAIREIGEIQQTNREDREEAGKKAAVAQNQYLARILDTFSDSQKQSWQKLTGDMPQGASKAKATVASNPPAAGRSNVEASSADGIAFFEKKIRPVLVDKCYQCHAADSRKIKGGLVLDTRDGIRKGGDTGPAVVPGDPAKSLLVEAINFSNKDLQMPPEKSGGKLPDEVIADFTRWVKMGAPDPREGTAPVAAGKSSWDTNKAKDHWAFKQPHETAVPIARDVAWAHNDIDRFILAGLEKKGITPVGDAEKCTLLRRVTFDLTGLPPTQQALQAFLNDASPTAFETVVDALLQSPRFGERWGRHWLDVARYAESTGRDVNLVLPHAWRYRDYVIDAFNADKPYNQFIREQIAGDLLPAKNSHERALHEIATGFLAIGSRNLTERDGKQFALDMADEQIDTVSRAVLGMTVSCARCHDHKFDPIPQRDYYGLAGIFLSTETLFGTTPTFENRRQTALIELPTDCGLPRLAKKLSPADRSQLESDLTGAQKLGDQILADLAKDYKAKGEGASNNVTKLIRANAIAARIGQFQTTLDFYDSAGSPKMLAMGVRDFPVEAVAKSSGPSRHLAEAIARRGVRPVEFTAISDSPLFARGDAAKPTEKVPRGFVGILGSADVHVQPGESGRKELAEWLVSPSNPLTARVYVNRIWQGLFGRGIVQSVDNFGTTGLAPSDQALLDHLALQFQQNGWSTKKLIRQMVLSHAYQLAAKYDENNFIADPENTLIWRHSPTRLEAECIRDAMLTVSGSIRFDPPVGSALAMLGDAAIGGRKIKGLREPLNDDTFLTAGGDFRSIYLPMPRNAIPDSLSVFDFAEPNEVAGQRESTTVPAQALYLLNSEFVGEHAHRFAEALLKLSPSDRVEQGFVRAFARPPSATERKAAQALLANFSEGPDRELAAYTSFCRALFSSGEFRMTD